MTEAYHTEDMKLVKMARVPWTFDECMLIHNIFHDKGYNVNCVDRIGADGKWHDAFQIERKDAPVLVEQLFRQRLVAEYQAEGHGNAAIIFSHNYACETIIAAVKKFQKNRVKP